MHSFSLITVIYARGNCTHAVEMGKCSVLSFVGYCCASCHGCEAACETAAADTTTTTTTTTSHDPSEPWVVVQQVDETSVLSCGSIEENAMLWQNLTDGERDRCMVAIPPADWSPTDGPLPVLFLFVGLHPTHQDCGNTADEWGYDCKWCQIYCCKVDEFV